MLSQRGNTLIAHAISKFSPEVFEHPVLLRFGKQDLSTSLKIADNLLSTAKNLQNDDPIGACQILLLCAVYQNYAGQSQNAWMMVQNALALARQSNLSEEILWALWGACAICFQQRNCKQAASLLEDMQVELTKRNEWVLANFVTVVKESLLQQDMDSEIERSGISQKRESADLLKLTFDCLQQWGYFAQFPIAEYITTPKNLVNHATKRSILKPSLPIQNLQARWHSLMRIFKNKMNRFSESAQLSSLSIPAAREQILEVDGLAPIISPKISEVKSEKEPISLMVYYLGSFRVFQNEQLISSWNSMKSQIIFKYLASLKGKPVAKDILMDMFWPEADLDSARRNLHQAIYSLRQTLRKNQSDFAHVQFENNFYFLNPEMDVWCDFQEFEQRVNTGKLLESQGLQDEACLDYAIAESIYQGDFLEEDLYDEWPREKREYLRVIYLDITKRLIEYHLSRAEYTSANILCRKVLNRDNYQEQVHRLLIQCYLAQGQRHLALRQYHNCIQTMMDELGLEPEEATLALYSLIIKAEQ